MRYAKSFFSSCERGEPLGSSRDVNGWAGPVCRPGLSPRLDRRVSTTPVRAPGLRKDSCLLTQRPAIHTLAPRRSMHGCKARRYDWFADETAKSTSLFLLRGWTRLAHFGGRLEAVVRQHGHVRGSSGRWVFMTAARRQTARRRARQLHSLRLSYSRDAQSQQSH